MHCGCSKIMIHNNSNNFTTKSPVTKRKTEERGQAFQKMGNVSYNNFKAIPLCQVCQKKKKKVGAWEEYNVNCNNKTRHNISIVFIEKYRTDKLCELKSYFKK